MGPKSSPKIGTSFAKLAIAALLASAATGCSSDATRFSGLLSKDNFTTASIPQRQVGGAYGQAPTPEGDMGGAQAPVAQNDYGSRPPVNNQSYPGNNGGYSSPARSASAPVSVQRSDLSAPGASSSSMASRPSPVAERDLEPRRQAMAQPLPNRASSGQSLVPPTERPGRGDNVVTGSTPMSGWSTTNAPRVTLKPGETAATLARRYGVPEKEIVKANGGVMAPGQSVIIPTFGPSRASAKTASGDIDLQNKVPTPGREPEQKLAVLPSASRDKSMAEPAKLTPPGGKPLGGSYTVKSGDTVAKIARMTETPIDQLKAANGITAQGVRIGQTLKVANSVAAEDPVKTASIPEKPAAPAKVVTASAPAAAAPVAAAAPAAPKPAETASLTDVEKKSDSGATAPQSTGIGKYRWPVSGAVIAGYGSNVDGNRNDGIDISVPEGTPIKAAENGVVIYAGNGLKQLGNTVLVRHDDGRVTVYGHAGSIGVTRGQKVTRGQTLAQSGMSGDAKRPQVHFEVRKDATPVNPITFLE
jgi:murein DD-endopeptidase MepM/ murein hydrolase activator NlpD